MSKDAGDVLLLSGCLDFSSVQKLAADLLDTDTELSAVQINAAEVEQIGTPAVQVLLAAAQQIASEGREFVVVDETDTFRHAFEDLGLTDQVTQWSNG